MQMKSVGGKYGVGNLSRIIFVIIALVSVLYLPRSGAAAVEQPLAQLQEVVDGIINILKDEQLAVPEMQETRRKKVEAQVDRLFDFQEMGKRTLGTAWDKATVAEKKEFVELFANLVKERYIGKVDAYSGQEVVFKKQVVKEKSAIVYSYLLNNGAEVPIDYKLLNDGGRWLAYDLRIENVSLVANYRRDFFSIIKNEGFGGLLVKMRDKIEMLDAGGQ